MADELWQLDATAQADLIRSGSVSAVEMVGAALDRVEATAELHAVASTFADRALRRAAVAAGPFAGVPIVLKDAGQELAGTPMSMGSTVLAEHAYVSSTTTELARQLEGLGFVIIGKAAVPELMSGISTEPPTGPPAANPWATELTTGGSSGGSAASVAAGIVPLAHGSDSTGSLRFPASCCGALTLKPTAGRISSRLPAGVANADDAHCDFVLARSARDLRTTFDYLAVPPIGQSRPLQRVGLLDAMPFGLPIDSDVEQALVDVGRELADIGLDVEPVSSGFIEDYGTVLGEVITTIVDAHRFAVINWIEDQIGRQVAAGDLSDPIIDAAERGRRLTPDIVAAARSALRAAALRAAAWAVRLDGLLMPILDVGPWLNGTPGTSGRFGGLLCSFANFSGQPSLAIPTVQRGLPVGVQLQAGTGQDEALLDLARIVRPTAPVSPYLSR